MTLRVVVGSAAFWIGFPAVPNDPYTEVKQMLIDRFSSQAAQAVALLILGSLRPWSCDSSQRG